MTAGLTPGTSVAMASAFSGSSARWRQTVRICSVVVGVVSHPVRSSVGPKQTAGGCVLCCYVSSQYAGTLAMACLV